MSVTLSVNRDPGVYLLASTEVVRTVSGLLQDVGSFSDVRRFAQRVRNLEAEAALLRQATQWIEQNWASLPDDRKQELYRVVRQASDRVDPSESDRSGSATRTIPKLRALWMRLRYRRILRTVEDAEDALFWFIDAVFTCAEGDSTRVQSMLSSRLSEAKA